MFTTHIFRARKYDATGKHTGPGRWLDLVWASNEIEPGFFGSPALSKSLTETYTHAEIVHDEAANGDIRVIATDEHGEQILTAARAMIDR